jgi:hypothetical protein
MPVKELFSPIFWKDYGFGGILIGNFYSLWTGFAFVGGFAFVSGFVFVGVLAYVF